MKIYRGEFVDIETDLNNANIQATKRIDILDGNTNPYNVVLSEVVVGPNTTYTFTFDTLPATATGTVIEYTSDGGINWFSVPGGTTSPQQITLPTLPYYFSFTIVIPGGWIYWSSEDEIVELEMADDPLRDIVIDNDEDVFTPIRARQLEIKIHSSSSVNINKFSIGGDNSFKVNYYIDSVLQFTGFLSLGDLSQEFLPDPNIITLVATDGLGFLKDIPLTDFDGDNPENENAILDYLLWALYKTGLRLNLAVTFNIREVTASTLNADSTGAGHFFKFNYLDAKTFEDEAGTCINCFDVIARILGEEGQLSQFNGEWRIIRIDEMEHGLSVQTVFRWDYAGTFISKTTETHAENIGVGESYSWMNDDARVSLQRLIKESRLIFNYEVPKEIPCNIEFLRGTILGDTPTLKTYSIDCWTKLYKDGTGDHPAAGNMYIEVQFLDGYEINRYLHFEDNGVFNFIMSSPIYVGAGDRATINVDRRMESNHSTAGTDNCVQLRLYGDDGTFWTHHGKNPSASPDADVAYWVACDSLFQTNQKFHCFHVADDYDDTESTSLFSGEVGPIPVAGEIRMLIYVSALWGGVEDTYIEQASFDYLPYINGSFEKFTGQEHIVKQDVDTRSVREKEVFISDSPKKIFKGALLIEDSGAYPLAGLFYNAAQEPTGPVNEKRYGEIQAFDVWNQYNRTMVILDGTVDHSAPPPNLITKFAGTDANENTQDRLFLLLHYELDAFLCEWNAFLIEVSRYDAKVYTGNSFKYLT